MFLSEICVHLYTVHNASSFGMWKKGKGQLLYMDSTVPLSVEIGVFVTDDVLDLFRRMYFLHHCFMVGL